MDIIKAFMKRFVPLLCCALMCVAAAADTGVYAGIQVNSKAAISRASKSITVSTLELDGLKYTLEQEPDGELAGTALVTGMSQDSDAVSFIIPDEIRVPERSGGARIYRVTAIADAAFAMSGIEAVTLPAGLESIGNAAFYHCSSLKGIKIPAGVENIGTGAFSYCDSLVLKVDKDNPHFTMKYHVLYTADMTVLMYADSKQTGRLNIPDGVVKIADYAFEGNNAVIRVCMPDTLISIGSGAFYDCRALKRVDISSSAEEINGNPFMYCAALERFTVDKSNKAFCATRNGLLLSRDKHRLISASAAAGSLSLPKAVTEIGAFSAAGNTRLTRVTFGKKLKTVGEGAFYDCSGLTGAYFKNGSFKLASGEKVFGNCDRFIEINIPYSAFVKTGVKKSLKNNAPAGAVIVTR